MLPALPQMVQKVVASKLAQRLITYLIYNPLTAEQEQQSIGKLIIAALQNPLEKFDKPEERFELITTLLEKPLTTDSGTK